MKKGFLVLEDGEVFSGEWVDPYDKISNESVGEVVFNTSHSGYEEIATDPSYFSQIVVMTASQQGNYGVSDEFWESENIWIKGFVCLEVQNSERDSHWVKTITEKGVPILTGLDTRSLTFHLRDLGTPWGALVCVEDEIKAREIGKKVIQEKRVALSDDGDWPFLVSCKEAVIYQGDVKRGPRVAVLDFGCKKNIVRELIKRCSEVKVFPSRTKPEEIKGWQPDGLLLSNGPGDPALVKESIDNVKELLGWKPLFGICMGHQILALALGAKTYKLKFGHRGANHPIEDKLLNKVYVTSQNHGYAVQEEGLSSDISVTHINLNDRTVAGISCDEKKCFSVQFHPESHPGPRDSVSLFDYFVGRLL
ncbi:MAG: glutamine-hydrolyzing carbamoyl-phosphate synthase small subunit [Bdellovibrionales bacterium]|nr:glutamine-hydrolyzing carbamoyl-phosphate synthase small subunit [Bdellovibrionales bacterium]